MVKKGVQLDWEIEHGKKRKHLNKLLKAVFLGLSKDKYGIDVLVPGFDKIIECEIEEVNAISLFHLPLNTRVITKGLLKDETFWEDDTSWGSDGDKVAVIRKVPLNSLRVELDWIKNQYKIVK